MGKDTYYFPHDFNARNDPKLIALRHKYKAIGMAVYWTIIEFLHEQDGNKFEPKSYIISTLAEQSGANAEQVLEVIKSCVDEFDLLRSDESCYVSDRVLRNIQKREEISEARSISGKKGALSKANAKQTPANAKQTPASAEQKPANAEQSSANKGNKGKERDRARACVFIPPTIPELHSEFIKKGFTEKLALVEANKFFSHYQSNGWKVGKNKMVSWIDSVSGWVTRINDFKKSNGQADQPVEVRDGN